MRLPSATHRRRRAGTVVRGLLIVGAAVFLLLWLAAYASIEGPSGAAEDMAASAGLATLSLIGLVFLLFRENRRRAGNEAKLVEQQRKLEGACRELAADAALCREAAEQWRIAQTTLRDAVDRLSEALVVYDPDDRVVLYNEAFQRLYPATAELMAPGTPYLEVVRGIAASGRVADAVGREEEWVAQRVAAHRRASGAVEHRLADGRRVITTERRMRNGGTAVLRIDITPLRRAEERQRELEKQLHHAQKLEAVGTLAAGIAHGLNNALMPILALSEMALTTLPAERGECEDMEIIAIASRRAQTLVQRLVSFSRRQQIVKRPVDLVRVVRSAVEMLRPGLPAGIRLTPEIGTVPRMPADADQLRQVVVDLVTNAAQAIGTGKGTITVGLETYRPPPAADGRSEEFVRLFVADTGCGMDPQTVRRVFEPFFTTRGVGEGSGLGLAVVHGIVTQHGGTIRVRSKPGRGSEFVIMLPLADIHAAPEAATAA
ncbi:MAG TPA: ATP-binding protein [Stellaceae bacterium]|nr:ATP-binding protein [Stellaceae bacterium]